MTVKIIDNEGMMVQEETFDLTSFEFTNINSGEVDCDEVMEALGICNIIKSWGVK